MLAPRRHARGVFLILVGYECHLEQRTEDVDDTDEHEVVN